MKNTEGVLVPTAMTDLLRISPKNNPNYCKKMVDYKKTGATLLHHQAIHGRW
jgi:hypothetical protein